MVHKKTAICAALIALAVAGMVPHSAFADGDKDKKKKDPVIIGPITTTNDPPTKKK